MSTETIRFSRRIVSIVMCIALLMTSSLILAPGVGAASDTNKKTETSTKDSVNIISAEDKLLIQRAITIDEARKEAAEVVSEQLAIQEAEAKEAESTAASESAKPQDETVEDSSVSASDSSVTENSSSSESESDSSYESESNDSSYAAYSGSSEFLMSIDNPDYSYTGCVVYLSDDDRDITERIIMGEAGSQGFEGMALVAQCIRDTYVCGSYGSIRQLLSENGYYGSTSITPSQTAKDVVSYIFDQGGSAVQHRIRVFYASNLCSSSWHEAQTYVCSYGYVRYFDF